MTNKNKQILGKIKALARNSSAKASNIYLFGSRARGEAKKGSDWDILIVMPKKSLQQADYDEVSFPFVELGWNLGEQINPMVFTEEEWEANRITPFYDNVVRDGISLI